MTCFWAIAVGVIGFIALLGIVKELKRRERGE